MIPAPSPAMRFFSADLTRIWHRHNHTSPADQAANAVADQVNQIP
jgi:hypothetical protein